MDSIFQSLTQLALKEMEKQKELTTFFVDEKLFFEMRDKDEF